MILGIKSIFEIIKELLFFSHADIQFSVDTNIETKTNTAEDRWQEEEDGEHNVDLFLPLCSENCLPVKHINIAVSCNYCWQRAIQGHMEHVPNGFKEANYIIV